MKFDIVRAWKDDTYRQSLSNEQLNTLPANPAGELELNESDLASVAGGWGLTLISRAHLFSVSLFANSLNSTCVFNENQD